MKQAQFNINTLVTVKLTDTGIHTLRRYHYEYQELEKETNRWHVIKEFKEPKDGMFTAQMWHLMTIFGDCMEVVGDEPFEEDILLHGVESRESSFIYEQMDKAIDANHETIAIIEQALAKELEKLEIAKSLIRDGFSVVHGVYPNDFTPEQYREFIRETIEEMEVSE